MGFVHYFYILACIATATAFSFFFTPPVNILAFKIGAVDVPKDDRRMHKHPISRLGGIAIFGAFIISLFFFGISTPFLNQSSQVYGMLIGASIIVVLGVLDDIYRLRARGKFAVQIIAALIAALFGVRINLSSILGGSGIVMTVLSILVSVLWIVAITNALNLIDGLDGLASGISVISTISFTVIMIMLSNIQLAMTAACLTGACLGFLPFNKHPAVIFMGDTGATFLGFILACLSVQGLYQSNLMVSLAVPFLTLAVPVFDTCYSYVRRIVEHKPPFGADRMHIHHKLIDLGLSQSRAVALLYTMSIGMALCATFLVNFTFSVAVLLTLAVFLILLIAMWIITYPIFHGHKK